MGRRGREGGFASCKRLAAILVVWAVCQADASESEVVLSDTDVINAGRRIFAQNCSVGYCHGKEGRAGRGPRLRGKKWDDEYLYRVTLKGIPRTAMPGWEGKLSHGEILSLVAYIQTLSSPGSDAPDLPRPVEYEETVLIASGAEESEERPVSVAEVPLVGNGTGETAGNSGRGRELFFDVTDDMNCAVCHRIDGKGAKIGFDLDRIAENTPRRIFRDIVLPNQRVEEAGRLFSLVLKDGEEARVLTVGESPTRLRVFDVSSFPPVTRSVRKEEIRFMTATERSAMPDSYARRYTLQQLLDLVTFIKSVGNSPESSVTLGDIL